MTDAITVRRAQRSDLPALGRLGALLMATHERFDSQRFLAAGPDAPEAYARFLGEELEHDSVAIFVAEQVGEVAEQAGEVAEQAGELVGYVYAGVEGKSWKELRDTAGFIHDVAIVEPARRQGLGERLIEVAAGWLAEQGVARVLLWTAERNTVAQGLFAKLGFRRTMIEMTREVPTRPSEP